MATMFWKEACRRMRSGSVHGGGVANDIRRGRGGGETGARCLGEGNRAQDLLITTVISVPTPFSERISWSSTIIPTIMSPEFFAVFPARWP